MRGWFVDRNSELWPGWTAPLGPLQTHLFGLFAPNWCHLRGVPDGRYLTRTRTGEASVSPCEARSCTAAAAGLFIPAAPAGWVSPPPVQSNAGLGRGTRPPAFDPGLSLLGNLRAEEVIEIVLPKWVKPSRSKIIIIIMLPLAQVSDLPVPGPSFPLAGPRP